MTDARSEIFAKLRRAGDSNIKAQSRSPMPTIDFEDPLSEFIRCAKASKATVSCHGAAGDVPAMVAGHLEAAGMPSAIKYSDSNLLNLDWSSCSLSEFGPCDGSEKAALATAVSGIAETGTLVSHSDINLSTATLFLPEVSLFLLDASNIVATQEDFWRQQKADQVATPRTYNFVTGPSRTGDIEQTIQMGAHGPYKVHIFILNCDK